MDATDRESHDRFLRMFMENEEALRLFVRSLLFTHEEAREVMQEVAIVLWRKFDQSMDNDQFRRWAFGVARMETMAYRRDRARDRHCFGDDVAELLERTIQEDAPTRTSQNSKIKTLETCIGKLSTEQRDLVETAYEPGVKMNRLAESLGWTPMALYKKLHRIRLALMKCIQREIALTDSKGGRA